MNYYEECFFFQPKSQINVLRFCIGNLIAYVAAVFLANVSSCLKKTGVMKMYRIFLLFFFATRLKILHFSRNSQFFSKITVFQQGDF